MSSENRKTPLFKLNQPDDTYKFQPLPEPSGEYPYRLNPALALPDPHKMVFQIAGDTGGLKSPSFQKLIAEEMGKQYHQAKSPADQPQFL